MAKAPKKCPMCGEQLNWKRVDTTKKGFSVGKAAVGGILIGPIGLVAGGLGKKKSSFYSTFQLTLKKQNIPKPSSSI